MIDDVREASTLDWAWRHPNLAAQPAVVTATEVIERAHGAVALTG